MVLTGVVYLLIDPRTNAVRYVGKTKYALHRRIYYHLWMTRTGRGTAGVYVWLRELAAAGVEPRAVVAGQAPVERLFALEAEWRRWLEEIGCDLVNRRYAPNAGTEGRRRTGAALRGRKKDPAAIEKTRATVEEKRGGVWPWNTPEGIANATAGRAANKGPVSCLCCRREFKSVGGWRLHQRSLKK